MGELGSSETDGKLVSVIVPHFDDLVALDKCLTSLSQQECQSDLFEIIVADNASPQGIEAVSDVVAGRARIVLIRERGAGPNRNGGVAVATGENLAFIDSDCVASPRWLSSGLLALKRFDVVGGKVSIMFDKGHRLNGVEAFEAVFAFDNKSYIEKKGFTGSGNLFVAKSVFKAVGGFKKGVSEDVEWSRRATSCGFTLGYAEDAEVGHPPRRSWDELRTKWRRLSRESYLLSKEKRFGSVVWLIRCAATPLSALIHTPKMLFTSRVSDVRSRCKGVVVLYRIRVWRLYEGVRTFISKAK